MFKRNCALLVTLLSAPVVSLSVHAASLPLKPGLWQEETTVTRGGMQSPTIATKHCMSASDMNKNRFNQTIEKMKSSHTCHIDQFDDSGSSILAKWSCSGENVAMHGEGNLTIESDTHFQIATTEHTTAASRRIDTTVKVDSHWISECGIDGN
jgi:hypothetical protein